MGVCVNVCQFSNANGKTINTSRTWAPAIDDDDAIRYNAHIVCHSMVVRVLGMFNIDMDVCLSRCV